MRLWHKDMIPKLPKQQLLSQWRECCCIGVLLAKNHTPNHILVNPILDYPPEHFEKYCGLVMQEMKKRGFHINESTLKELQTNLRAWRIYLEQDIPWDNLNDTWDIMLDKPLFEGWHDDRYLNQCYYNLEEKADRGGIPKDEWLIIFANYGRYI